MELLFAHTPTYPDEAPCIRLRAVTGVSDADISAATKVLQQQVRLAWPVGTCDSRVQQVWRQAGIVEKQGQLQSLLLQKSFQ